MKKSPQWSKVFKKEFCPEHFRPTNLSSVFESCLLLHSQQAMEGFQGWFSENAVVHANPLPPRSGVGEQDGTPLLLAASLPTSRKGRRAGKKHGTMQMITPDPLPVCRLVTCRKWMSEK